MIDARTPRAAAASETVERFMPAYEAVRAAVPDMSPSELIFLREAIADLDEVIETEQAEREWVARNEH